MTDMNGITLAKQLKICKPTINIIFTTGYSTYQQAAFNMHASGYIEKPVTPAKVIFELNELRNPIEIVKNSKLLVKAFGNFEVYVDGIPLEFRYTKSKELFAYLIDRNGALCSNGEIMTSLWEDDNHVSYMKNSRADLMDVLKKNNVDDVIVRQWGKIGVLPKMIDCDYYDWLNNEMSAINSYHGEYMNQYSWAELTHATIEGQI